MINNSTLLMVVVGLLPLTATQRLVPFKSTFVNGGISTFNHPKISASSKTNDAWPIPTSTSSSGHQPYRRNRLQRGADFIDHRVDMEELLKSMAKTSNEEELFALLSPYKGGQLSERFMVSLLREPDWQRSMALLDWFNDVALYTQSVFVYNVVIRNVLRAKQWVVAQGLFDEMRQKALAPDRYTCSMLITHFGKEGMFDSGLSFLHKMEQDKVSGDLVLYSNLIELSRRLCDYSKAISLFSRMKRSGIKPDLVVYNSMINVFGKAKLFPGARQLLTEFRENGVVPDGPDTSSYSTLLSMYVENGKFVEALSVFSEMKVAKCGLDLTCNIMLDAYGQLDMPIRNFD